VKIELKSWMYKDLFVEPKDLPLFFDALSGPRIRSYQRYFGANYTDEMILGCYKWNDEVSSTLFKVITLIEIVMRNRMHSALSQHYFNVNKKVVANCKPHIKPWNYMNTATIGNQFSCNWYEAEILERKSLDNIHNKTHHYRNKTPFTGHRRPSPDDTISSLTFGFWSSIIGKNPAIDWDNILGVIYPKHRASSTQQWGSHIQKKRLIYRLELVRDFRNRIAHHEPIWKLPALLDETPPVGNGKRNVLLGASVTQQESISRLRSIYSKHSELLRWMSQEIYADLKASTLHSKMLWLCSKEGFDAHVHDVSKVPKSMAPARFKRELKSVIRSKKMVYIKSGNRNLIAAQPIFWSGN